MTKSFLEIAAGVFIEAAGIILFFLVSNYLLTISTSLVVYTRLFGCCLYLLGAFIIASRLTTDKII